VLVLLRSSSEHILIVRPPRAQETNQAALPSFCEFPFSPPNTLLARRLVWSPLRASSHFPISLPGVAWLILVCARRTSTFLSCAFREQEDNQAALPILPRPRVPRAQETDQAALPVPQEFSPSSLEFLPNFLLVIRQSSLINQVSYHV
jgi:hypothetical protein